jgi:hypothetical protein
MKRLAFRRLIYGLLFWLLLSSIESASSVAQRATQNDGAVTALVNSVAGKIYKLAWPTATYKSVSIEDFEPVDGGVDVTVRLSGSSGFDGSELWLDLVFLVRDGKLQTFKVRDHNAILVPPFITSGKMAEALVALGKAYDQRQNQTQVAKRNETQSPQTARAVSPSASSPTSLTQAPPPAREPMTFALANPPAAAPATVAVGKSDTNVSPVETESMRAYFLAAEGGFASIVQGEPTVGKDGTRSWLIPVSTSLCSAYDMPIKEVVCMLNQVNKSEASSAITARLLEFSASEPAGWIAAKPTAFSAQSETAEVIKATGPGGVQASMQVMNLDDPAETYQVYMVLQFPR